MERYRASAASVAASSGSDGPPDLLILCSRSPAMGAFVSAARKTIPSVLGVARLATVFRSVGVVAYGDYATDSAARPPVSFSGWHTRVRDILPFTTTTLQVEGTGHNPDAAKSAIVEVVTRPTVVLWFAAAPPHIRPSSPELAALGAGSYDWVALSRRLAAARVSLYAIMSNAAPTSTLRFFTFATTATGGACIVAPDTSTVSTTRTAINVLMALMGAPHDEEVAERVAYRRADVAAVSHATSDADQKTLFPTGSHWDESLSNPLERGSLVFPPVPVLHADFSALLAKFHGDEEYRKMVYLIIGRLLTPAYIVSLTCNAAFGAFWRVICERRKDERRDVLLARISKTMPALGTSSLVSVRKWLDESYNRAAEIESIVAEEPAQFPALILEVRGGAPTWKAQEFLEVAHSCKPAILRRVSELIAGCRVVTSLRAAREATVAARAGGAASSEAALPPSGPLAFRRLPLSLDDGTLFRLLPHLMCPGTMVTMRPAVIVAIISVITGSTVLAPRARTFLASVRGKWFDPAATENYAWGFVKLVLRVPEALTPDELALFTHLRNIGGLMINGRTEVTFKRGIAPEKGLRPDTKVHCHSCGKMRSFTLIAADGRCGLCHAKVPSAPETAADNASYWCECRACHAHYAVAEPALLKQRAKCHFCRESGRSSSKPKKASMPDTPTLSCKLCRNDFICVNPRVLGLPAGGRALALARAEWVCPPCAVNGVEASLSDATATIGDLMRVCAANRALVLGAVGLDAPGNFDIFASTTLFRAKDVMRADAAGARVPASEAEAGLLFGGKPVLTSLGALEQVQRWALSGGAEGGTCTLCFDDLPKSRLMPVCGRRGCTSVACEGCLTGWYGAIQPGGIVSPSNLECPFCKRAPSAKTLSARNPRACELSRRRPEFDPGWYYAWCISCYAPRQYAPKECQGEAPPVADFVCRECTDAAAAAALAADAAAEAAELAKLNEEQLAWYAARKKHRDGLTARRVAAGLGPRGERTCPRCGVMVLKVDGCDHITCLCGCHWCYRCGHGDAYDSAGSIYEHMYRCTGPAGAGDAGDAYDSDDDDDRTRRYYDGGYLDRDGYYCRCGTCYYCRG